MPDRISDDRGPATSVLPNGCHEAVARVIELHGSLSTVGCLECGRAVPRAEVQQRGGELLVEECLYLP